MASPGSPVANSFMFYVLPCPMPRKSRFPRFVCVCKLRLNTIWTPVLSLHHQHYHHFMVTLLLGYYMLWLMFMYVIPGGEKHGVTL